MRVFTPLFLVLLSTSAWAQVEYRSPISVSSEMGAWAADINARVARMKEAGTYPELGYIECALVQEIPDTVLCAHYDRTEMERAFIRPSIYIEGSDGYPKHSLANLNDEQFLKGLGKTADGIDLRGADLAQYYGAIEKKCEASQFDPNVCLSPSELDFLKVVVAPLARRNSHFTIITTTLNGLKKNRETNEWTYGPAGYVLTASHEVLHAQYFMQPAFAAVVDQFWNEQVSEEDRGKVRKILGDFGYDPSDELLMRNEFMAFLLQPIGPVRVFKNKKLDLDSLYRKPLGDALSKAGIAPIQVR